MTNYKNNTLLNSNIMKLFTALIVVFTSTLTCEKGSLNEVTASNLETETTTLDTYLTAEKNTRSIAYIAGFDEGENLYYTNAKTHFSNLKIPIIEGLYSLNEIIDHLNSTTQTFTEIHIISHSNPWAGMSLKVDKNGDRITALNLDKALENKKISVVNSNINANTKIIFHSCGLGANIPLIQSLKHTFTNDVAPQIVASPYFNIYGGDYVDHYLAAPYYVSYPTANSPGPLALSKEIALTYPEVDIDWQTALITRNETTPTTVYSYRFNIPVNWELSFNNTSEIPKLETREDIMDFVSEQDEMAIALYEIGIPIEKYRWIIKVSEEKKTIVIKGKTTVLCVLDPIENPNDRGNYAVPAFTNKNLYTIF